MRFASVGHQELTHRQYLWVCNMDGRAWITMYIGPHGGAHCPITKKFYRPTVRNNPHTWRSAFLVLAAVSRSDIQRTCAPRMGIFTCVV